MSSVAVDSMTVESPLKPSTSPMSSGAPLSGAGDGSPQAPSATDTQQTAAGRSDGPQLSSPSPPAGQSAQGSESASDEERGGGDEDDGGDDDDEGEDEDGDDDDDGDDEDGDPSQDADGGEGKDKGKGKGSKGGVSTQRARAAPPPPPLPPCLYSPPTPPCLPWCSVVVPPVQESS